MSAATPTSTPRVVADNAGASTPAAAQTESSDTKKVSQWSELELQAQQQRREQECQLVQADYKAVVSARDSLRLTFDQNKNLPLHLREDFQFTSNVIDRWKDEISDLKADLFDYDIKRALEAVNGRKTRLSWIATVVLKSTLSEC